MNLKQNTNIFLEQHLKQQNVDRSIYHRFVKTYDGEELFVTEKDFLYNNIMNTPEYKTIKKISIQKLIKMAVENELKNGTKIIVKYFCPPDVGDWCAVDELIYQNREFQPLNAWKRAIWMAKENDSVIVWAEIIK